MAANLTVLVVDDEENARARLCELLAQEAGIASVIECGTVPEAVQALEQHQPDLVFLDIQIRAASGFDVIERIGVQRMPLVVFVTAYQDYAIRAFDVHAVDYLLKPFDRARFRHAMARALAIRDGRDGAAAAESLRRAAADIAAWRDAQSLRARYAERIIVKPGGRALQVAEVARIDWIEAAANYVILHVDGQRLVHRETMQALEQRLDPQQFARVHRSALVNMARVASLTPWSGGDYHIRLKGGAQVKLSRTFRASFERRIEQISQ